MRAWNPEVKDEGFQGDGPNPSSVGTKYNEDPRRDLSAFANLSMAQKAAKENKFTESDLKALADSMGYDIVPKAATVATDAPESDRKTAHKTKSAGKAN